MTYILLIVGFFLLVKGADIFVDGASGIAKFFKIPSLVIGLTIVSIGTSAPEAAVSITAGLQGSNEIALGNIVGSNIFNTAIVIGACALIKAINIDNQIIKKDFPFMMISSVVAAILALNGMISRIDGIILLGLFLFFMGYIIKYAMKNKTPDNNENNKINLPVKILMSIAGAILIVFGGDLVVNNAKMIALSFNISEAVIGLTVVAVGTSLPELVTSIVAAKKGESDIAIGNVVGSNIFNILFILGISSAINPIPTNFNSVVDLLVFIGVTVFVFIFAKLKGKIERNPAIILILSYVIYTAYIVMR